MVSGELCKILLTDYKLTRLEAFEIIAHFCNMSKEQILLDREIEEENAEECKKAASVLNMGQPLQYIIGQWDFCGRKILCRKGVLIPREDTETLVNEAQKFAPKKALDLCCGSGCISVALASKGAEVTAVDIEPEALALTKDNAALWNVELDIRQCNIITDEPFGEFDVIVSNPPYIKSGDIKKLDLSVKKYEPRLALDGGEDGMDFYRLILAKWQDRLIHGGHLLFEVGYDTARGVEHLMKNAGLADVFVTKDLNGVERVVGGKKL